MNSRTCLVAGVSAFLGLYLVLAIVSPTNAQFGQSGQVDDDVPDDLLPKVKGLERTDLFSGPQNLRQRADDSPEGRHRHAARRVDVARQAYDKLKLAREGDHRAISDEMLSGASLEWFKAEITWAKSKPEAIKAALEYLERECVK